MNLQLVVLSKLLQSTTGLLISAYVAAIFTLWLIIQFGNVMLFDLLYVLICLVLLGIQHYLSLRIKFDSALLATVSEYSKTQSLEQTTKELDLILINLKLMPANKCGRAWELRELGCLALFKWQIVVLCLQYIAFICIFLLYR
ncbi:MULTISPECIES: hypothetical protein [unclassified Acinetobacter]|uniref:hypothetical protein n=1 Tax=unclassified Acinetobacter TaxID=196816 RepID=UPI0015D2CB14|nr:MULTISPECIES: hypothetical protein [unclassified Acinetobacter]